MNADRSVCERTKEDGTKETKSPTCPTGSAFVRRENLGVCEPTTSESPIPSESQTTSNMSPTSGEGVTSGSQQTCPSGYSLTTTIDSSGSRDECAKLTEPMCPQGYRLILENCTKSGAAYVAPTCAEGTFDRLRLKCKTTVPVQQTSSTTTPTTSVTGTTTGGTAGNIWGPNSGGVGRSGKSIWGPVFTGLGQASGQDGDSTKTNRYPGLLGGMMGRESSRIPGVGIVPPSQPGFGLDLDGSVLPSSSSLGTDANSRFLPFSRPGMDADPYRLAKGFSTRNYSPENDPVPFLTDFSAFFR